jgi:hypothetical protein
MSEPTPIPPPRPWFPLRRNGLGWGPPQTWQGWAVLLLYIVCAVGSSFGFPPDRYPLEFTAMIWGWSFLLIAVCRWKGERPPPRPPKSRG